MSSSVGFLCENPRYCNLFWQCRNGNTTVTASDYDGRCISLATCDELPLVGLWWGISLLLVKFLAAKCSTVATSKTHGGNPPDPFTQNKQMLATSLLGCRQPPISSVRPNPHPEIQLVPRFHPHLPQHWVVPTTQKGRRICCHQRSSGGGAHYKTY
ncbi:hypothetical protein, unlikely [Trypanosoma brucei gambiense DAL972]|uniref:Uncharacterized protein n=1 Tax=Trypanosoma brucei gambiense (strain MHOM/CI/86/DAL972) TaxID=679716 RepID=D0A0Y2_TRYB9|nr:hypothetical protein, unlikely [Trypanosoma brucei gambiense DAL972]CBH14924.1 hypothetical protein, unlikely [Trypanosoma brucei gambiense DAL972]|eukprot:XP_011777190.1 hypothetical protein, unlikely [Trypanosoma brucei gambiense DAL972]